MEWNWCEYCFLVLVLLGIGMCFETVFFVFGWLMRFFSRLGGCKNKRMVYSRDNDTVRRNKGNFKNNRKQRNRKQRMRFEDQANTTALRMKKSAEAAFRRGDADRLKEILERANEYKERMDIRRLNARNTVHYNLGYENDAANASWLVDIVEGLIGRMA